MEINPSTDRPLPPPPSRGRTAAACEAPSRCRRDAPAPPAAADTPSGSRRGRRRPASRRVRSALPLTEPLAGGNLLADLVASIGRNDQTHHHPTVHGRGECAARPSLYRGEEDVSEAGALEDPRDVFHRHDARTP